MKFDKYAKGYDAGWRGTKSARFYDDLIWHVQMYVSKSIFWLRAI